MTNSDLPAPGLNITAGARTFLVTVVAIYITIFVFLRNELTASDWLILLALGLAFVLASMIGAIHFERTGSRRVLIPAGFLAIALAGAIIYRAAGFFLTGLILLPLASLGVQILSRRQAWLVYGLTILTLVTAYALRGGWEAAIMAGVGYLAALFFVVFITQTAVNERLARAEMERLAAELQEANRKLRAFAVQAEELAVTRERARLAHEIHDTVGHTLTALDVQLALLAHLPADRTEERRHAASEAQVLVKEGLSDMRRAVVALRPAALESFSLPIAIDGLVTQFTHSTGIPTEWSIEGEEVDLALPLALPLYRTAQEALTNIKRHAASASRVDITLRYECDAVVLSVFNARPAQGNKAPTETNKNGGHGLAGLRERAEMLGGTLKSDPDEAGGFRVEMRLPRAV